MSRSAAQTALPKVELSPGDDDLDSDVYPHEPDNESELLGHPANATDFRSVTFAVKSYYAAAARDDGKRACRFLYSVFARTVAEAYGSASGSRSLRGRSCGEVLTKLLRQRPAQMSHAGSVKVVAVRTDLNSAAVHR
jgi:hypothetical protein